MLAVPVPDALPVSMLAVPCGGGVGIVPCRACPLAGCAGCIMAASALAFSANSSGVLPVAVATVAICVPPGAASRRLAGQIHSWPAGRERPASRPSSFPQIFELALVG